MSTPIDLIPKQILTVNDLTQNTQLDIANYISKNPQLTLNPDVLNNVPEISNSLIIPFSNVSVDLSDVELNQTPASLTDNSLLSATPLTIS